MGSELIHRQRTGLFSMCVMLPDGTVRKPLDEHEFCFWSQWGHLLGYFEVGETFIGEILISTVFLMIDQDLFLGHKLIRTDDEWGFDMEEPDGYKPLVFETMVFGGPMHSDKERYRSRRRAKFGHKLMVLKVRDAIRKAKFEALLKRPDPEDPGDEMNSLM